MYIEFSEEQVMLRDSVEKYLRENYSFEDRQAIVKSQRAYSDSQWQTFADLGWLAMTFAEESNGFGGGALETMLVCEQFGKYLVVEPYLETVVLCGGIIESGATPELQREYLEFLIGGQLQGALAYLEAANRVNPHFVATSAQAVDGGYQLKGTKAVVFNGPQADVLLVTARTSGAVDDASGISVFAVAADAAGVSRRSYKTYDGHSACELELDDVVVAANCLVGAVDCGMDLVAAAIDRGVLAVCAEAVGAMDALLATTTDYTNQRKQFGKPISTFQVLRHRMADMFMHIELCRSLLMATAWKLDHNASGSRQCLSALKAKVGKSAQFVAHNAIQLHGGIGTTDELNVGHYFKRLAAIGVMFGSRDQHLASYFQQQQV